MMTRIAFRFKNLLSLGENHEKVIITMWP
jgi:hypothetical protein